MKANQRAEQTRQLRTPDGGQMLLLAGFLLASAAIIAIGTLQVVQRTQTQVYEAQRTPVVDLFINTRDRAVDYFGTVIAADTAVSVESRLNDYLRSQYASARQLNLELNATLAGAATLGDKTEANDFVFGGVYMFDASTPVCSWDYDAVKGTGDCYDTVAYDGTNDGLIVDAATEQVLAAIIYLEVSSTNAILYDTLVIDVPAT